MVWRKAALPIRKPRGSSPLPTGAGPRPVHFPCWRTAEGTIPRPLPVPSAFKAVPTTWPVGCPLLGWPAEVESANDCFTGSPRTVWVRPHSGPLAGGVWCQGPGVEPAPSGFSDRRSYHLSYPGNETGRAGRTRTGYGRLCRPLPGPLWIPHDGTGGRNRTPVGRFWRPLPSH